MGSELASGDFFLALDYTHRYSGHWCWRFSLDITPSFHYLITNNFTEYRQDIDPLTERPVGSPSLRPVRWHFSISGGLSWLF